MLRLVATAVAVVALSGFAGGAASAKSCRDAHGKFIKCPPAMTVPAARCRDAKGKFKKCSTMKKS